MYSSPFILGDFPVWHPSDTPAYPQYMQLSHFCRVCFPHKVQGALSVVRTAIRCVSVFKTFATFLPDFPGEHLQLVLIIILQIISTTFTIIAITKISKTPCKSILTTAEIIPPQPLKQFTGFR
ncbi:hypothetical protein GDO78_023057 [Eleutherodactylus coqui]|uniref:Uncharacterized protein n=1 Tax=Eleutherodactylus coqui TaxID=57060 RepID=A0A8J6B2A9_ELECQ|nr:hypothetical protein GDO78_023057 [Eleutherodactylus coqui]